MIEGFVQLERGVRQEDQEQMMALAKTDDHAVFFPTMTIRKGDRLAGWISINGVPHVFAHFSTKELKPRDSFSLINSVENHVALGGAPGIIWPIPSISPFHKLMPSLGYTSIGNYELFFKKL